nr:AAA family ATPase [Bacilli bacterium]
MSKKKMRNGFTYRADIDRGEILLANSKDTFSESVFASIRARISSVKSLPNSLSIKLYPLDFIESPSDLLMRSYFKKENYRLLAARLDEEDEIIDFLITEKATPKVGLVISYSRLEVEVSFHDGCYVEEDEDNINPIDIFYESLDGDLTLGKASSHKPMDLGEIEEGMEEEEEVEVVIPKPAAFVPNSNKSIKNLGTSKKIIAEEKEEEKEDEGEEDIDISLPKAPSFVPTSKKGIPNLGSRFSDKKKKQAPKPPIKVEEEKEEPAKEEKEVMIPTLPKYFSPNSKKTPGKIIDRKVIPTKKKEEPKQDEEVRPVSIKPVAFSPSSNKKPKTIGDSYQWVSSKNVRFEYDKSHPQSKFFLNHGKNERSFDFESAYSAFIKITGMRIRFNCVFAPIALEEKSPEVRAIENFNPDEWVLLGVFTDAYKRAYRYLLANREDPYFSFACTLEKRPSVFCVSTIGFRVALYHGSYESLIEESNLFLEEEEDYSEMDEVTLPEEEEEVIFEEEEPLEEEPLIDIEKKENPREKAKEKRKILYTGHFKRQMEAFFSSNPVDGKREFDELLFALQTKEEDELGEYLVSKNSKVIVSSPVYRVRKFRFSPNRQFNAMRVFYLRGDSISDIDRKIGQNDILLLALSIKHEGQDKVAEVALEHFGKNSPIYFFAPPRFEWEENEKLVHLSSEQYRNLDIGESKLPAAFVGTAGSGKTLMSYQAYLDLSENDGKVLYLTYQRDLARQAEKTLAKMNVKNAEALTYRDLIRKIFGEETAKRMRTKDRFRAWFYDHGEKNQKNYNKEFSRLAGLLSENLEDAFHIAYVFYRGIIEGTMDSYRKKKKGILSKEEFLAKIGGEMGFEREQKDAIYEIALEYEKHLSRHNGLTDNKFALSILSSPPLEIYDAIIVDEYQDLTELQILSLTSLIKATLPHRILLFGDDNQAVNPTILNISGVNSVIQEAYKKDKKRCSLQINTLSSSYRSGPNLLSYINDVLLIKDKAIGKDKSENTLARKTFREDEDDLYVTRLENKNLFKTLLV